MPATPAATWPMSLKEYRKEYSKKMKQPGMKGNIFYQGKSFWAVESMGTDSLSTVILSAICLRGTEQDTENIKKIARTKKFWTLNSINKKQVLKHFFDVERLFEKFMWDELPTKYLKTYTKLDIRNANYKK